ncbi:hypothetical protein OnM2_020042 [Erysiphe neolycopersici]|uniref:Uncharacterized protein n=1 Tax=Erysiphe neolycopersici TaxID=212602 RepID=A0A420I3A1_9PEZI|nr:hypothetical protein OnM2_020042 [Erysiphe neolycopersici]
MSMKKNRKKNIDKVYKLILDLQSILLSQIGRGIRHSTHIIVHTSCHHFALKEKNFLRSSDCKQNVPMNDLGINHLENAENNTKNRIISDKVQIHMYFSEFLGDIETVIRAFIPSRLDSPNTNPVSSSRCPVGKNDWALDITDTGLVMVD